MPTLASVAQSRGFKVEDHAFDDETNGDCSHTLPRIRMRVTLELVQRAKPRRRWCCRTIEGRRDISVSASERLSTRLVAARPGPGVSINGCCAHLAEAGTTGTDL
jgi:hypothetical protein